MAAEASIDKAVCVCVPVCEDVGGQQDDNSHVFGKGGLISVTVFRRVRQV